MRFTTVELYVYPLETLHCGYGIEQGVVLPSLPYIPGRVIRGGLAGWALRNHKGLSDQDAQFQELFYFHESDDRISYPWCTPQGRLPAPLSLFELKGGTRDKFLSLVEAGGSVYIDATERLATVEVNGPIDFLRRDCFPAQQDAAFKSCNGTINEKGYEYFPDFQTGFEMKASHDKDTGRVKPKGEGGLRVEEVMLGSSRVDPEEIYYKGTLVYPENKKIDDLFSHLWEDGDMLPEEANLDDPKPNHLLYLGRKSVPTAVYAEEPETTDSEMVVSGDADDATLTVTLTSDCIFELSSNSNFRINRDTLFEQLGLNDVVSDLTDIRGFCRGGQLHGYDVLKNRASTWPSITAGSCIRFCLESLVPEQRRRTWTRLQKLSFIGVGKHRRDGCGRFKLNWQPHQLKGAENE